MKRIIHLSDPHFGAEDAATAAAFLKQANENPPDLTILSGDLTMRASRSEIQGACDFVTRLPSPRLIIPGNHDMPGWGLLAERFINPFRRYQSYIEEELEPEIYVNGLHLVSLNSARAWGFYTDWSEGRISKKQRAHLEERFSGGTPTDLRILVLHHPLVELQLRGRAVVKPLAPLLASMEKAKVDLVLCGHFHRSIIITAGLTGIWHSIISQAPTVCSIRLQGEPPGYHEILLDAGQAEVCHHVYGDGRFSVHSSTTFSRGENGWSKTTAPL